MELKNRKKNKDQGMQKLYFPKTSRGNKAGPGARSSSASGEVLEL